MPFGLTNAPATFQRLMDSVLRDEIGEFVQVYLDDVIIYSKTWLEHLEHIEKVFVKLHKAGLKLGPKKCKFAQDQIEFLGHIVTAEGIKPDPKKLELVKHWPQPTNKRGVRSFLGFMSYYRNFIEGFSAIAHNLHKVTKEKEEFTWGEPQQKAFDELKEKMLNTIVLNHPDYDKPFILSTDASGGGLGAILSQIDEHGKERPVAFASKSLTGAQTNYSATELELLAVIWAVTHKFSQYLLGNDIIVYSDHEALKYLVNKTKTENVSKRIQKWLMKLSGYQITVEYKSGTKNRNVDALSRMNSLLSHPIIGLKRPEPKFKQD
jgi:hypothetical protein